MLGVGACLGLLPPGLRPVGSRCSPPQAAARPRALHQAQMDRRLGQGWAAGGCAAAPSGGPAAGGHPQPCAAASRDNGSQAAGSRGAGAEQQLEQQEQQAATAAHHHSAEEQQGGRHQHQHQQHQRQHAGHAHGGEAHELSEASAQKLWQEVEQLRGLLVTQGELIAQQQHMIRLMEEQLGAQLDPRAAARAEADWARQELQQAGPRDMGVAEPAVGDRRALGFYDARYHSTSGAATPRDFRLLPRRIVLVRHAQSEGNVDNFQYTFVPDPKVPLTAKGWEQALDAGEKLKEIIEADGSPYKLFFYTSPYLRSKQTYEGLVQAFSPEQVVGVQEEVQLREQDFGNFQDAEGKKREKAERLRFGRFFYRFPNGESGADVYDRMTIFEDHLVRDLNAGRFGHNCNLVLVTHGLAARIFLMRWLHWTTDQFMNVFNPPNAEPIILERITNEFESRPEGPMCWIHTKALYRLTDESMDKLVGCTEDMCTTSWLPRGIDTPGGYKNP